MQPSLSLPIAILALVSQAFAQAPAAPAPPPLAEVLVLGVYHMANPGRDIFNLQADDVLVPKRQAEITSGWRRSSAIRPYIRWMPTGNSRTHGWWTTPEPTVARRNSTP